MKRMNITLTVLIFCIFLLSGCGVGSEKMTGPRSESAWKKWEEDQKNLKENWADTEIYAYVLMIMDDLSQVNAGAVFKEGFSAEEESAEAEALRKLYYDMNLGEEIPLEDFPEKLSDSDLRYAIGGPCELDSIAEQAENDDGYDVRIVYYANVDSLMPVDLPVTTDAGGKYTLIEFFLKSK